MAEDVIDVMEIMKSQKWNIESINTKEFRWEDLSQAILWIICEISINVLTKKNKIVKLLNSIK